MTALASLLVRAYRLLVSPFLGPRCKYHPPCSQYALDALREYGFVRGVVLTAWRLARCNPWSHGGVDYASGQSLFRRAPRHGARERSA
jgi:putative membrane protein insertion efficiency factor